MKKILLCSADAQQLKQAATVLERFLNEQGVSVVVSSHELEQGGALSVDASLSEIQQSNLEKQLKEFTNVDVLFFESQLLKGLKLFAFDMDSTLIEAEVIDELAAYANVQEEVKKITAAAMRGEINFEESFEQRIALLKGIDESALKEIAQSLPLMPGLKKLFEALNAQGIKTAILSGGFQYFADYLKELLSADYAFANVLKIEDGQLTGEYQGEIVGPERKEVLLREIAQKENIKIEQCAAVGDGANDLLMLQAAGVGIAFHAKPLLKEKINYHLDDVSLDALLVLLVK